MAINETALLASPLLGPLASIIETLSVLVGGIFGLYLILVIFRIVEYRKFKKLLKGMKIDIEGMSKKLDLARGQLRILTGKKPLLKKKR